MTVTYQFPGGTDMEKQEKILQEIAEKHFEEFVESQKKVKS
jgi:hypothetical protein